MYELWFLPGMNERFITNDMGEPPMMLGIEMEHDREIGRMYLHYHTSITRVLKKRRARQHESKPGAVHNGPIQATEIVPVHELGSRGTGNR
jgi:hypothetical protein